MTGRTWNADPTTPAARARRKEYDSATCRATRARLKKLVGAGEAYCWRCGRGSGWHAGHDDVDRRTARVTAPATVPCNRCGCERAYVVEPPAAPPWWAPWRRHRDLSRCAVCGAI